MGWLRNLFGGEDTTTVAVELPPIRVTVADKLQIVDLRAISDPAEALGAGVRVAVEMCRTLRDTDQRGFAFAAPALRVLLDEPARLAAIAKSLRAKLPALEKRTDASSQIRRGEVGLFVPPADLEAARAAFDGADLLPVADDRLGPPPPAARHVIRVPKERATLHDVAGVPGIGVAWNGELIFDLRRIGRIGWVAFSIAEKVIDAVPAPRRRVWIVPDWMENLGGASADKTLAKNRPAEGDRIVFDGAPPPAFARWAGTLGATVTAEAASGLRMGYAELVQNVLLAHALSSPA